MLTFYFSVIFSTACFYESLLVAKLAGQLHVKMCTASVRAKPMNIIFIFIGSYKLVLLWELGKWVYLSDTQVWWTMSSRNFWVFSLYEIDVSELMVFFIILSLLVAYWIMWGPSHVFIVHLLDLRWSYGRWAWASLTSHLSSHSCFLFHSKFGQSSGRGTDGRPRAKDGWAA